MFLELITITVYIRSRSQAASLPIAQVGTKSLLRGNMSNRGSQLHMATTKDIFIRLHHMNFRRPSAPHPNCVWPIPMSSSQRSTAVAERPNRRYSTSYFVTIRLCTSQLLSRRWATRRPAGRSSGFLRLNCASCSRSSCSRMFLKQRSLYVVH